MTESTQFYADFQGLASLKNSASKQDPKALREVAKQFESVFTQMMLKSMRTASLGESLLDNDQSKFYLEMFDNQMASQLSKGKGMGLADMLVRQLTQAGLAAPEVGESKQDRLLRMPDSAGFRLSAPQAAPISLEKQGAVPVALNKDQSNKTLTMPVRVPHSVAPTSRPVEPEFAPKVEVAPKATAAVEAVAPIAAATTSAKSVSARQTIAMTPDEFIRQMWPHAQSAGAEIGVDPHTLIAQAALETGWGKYVPCNPDGSCSFNLFGIKANSAWQGQRIGVSTLEFEGGVATRKVESFRAYSSPEQSFRDYAALIKNNPRYDAAVGAGKDANKFATALQQGGYATDPNYAQKLAATATSVLTRAGDAVKSALLKTDVPRSISRLGIDIAKKVSGGE
ncbi:MAG TPA: flagellar assembly peptidoglycan hydrolase FlgJ [Steroidobacteraceae bacterium]|nr:flagellar assembly peptidoglycan hydrolase FlgJ [Steroidobacteraceae bacterium]